MQVRITGRLLSIGFVCAAWAAAPQSTFAQGASLFGSSGVTKSGTGGISGTLGGTGFGSLTSGSSSGLGAAASALGGAAGARGATGAAGFGATGMTGATGAAGAGNSGFVGRTSTAMAGNSRATQTGNAGRTTSRATGGGNNNSFQSQNQPSNNSSMKRSSAIRPRQRVAFEVNRKTPEKVVATASTRLDRISIKNPVLKQVGIELKGDQVVLTGKVKSAGDSRLAENILRLEPGVKSIRNELEVEQLPVVE